MDAKKYKSEISFLDSQGLEYRKHIGRPLDVHEFIGNQLIALLFEFKKEVTPQWIPVAQEMPLMPGSYLVKLDPDDDNRINHFRMYHGPAMRLLVTCAVDTNILENKTAVWLKLSPDVPTFKNH